jgi:hypothetical protein
MVVEVDDIRDILIGITSSLVPDATISFWIDMTTDIVEGNLGAETTDDQKERAIKVGTAFYTLQSYSTYLQTSTGRVPNNIMTQANEMSRAFAVLLSLISRAEGPMAPPTTLIETTESSLDV